MTEVEAKKPQETLQDRLAQVVDLLQRRRLGEDGEYRQDGEQGEIYDESQILAELQRKLDELHPADVAHILEALPLEERLTVWQLVKAERDGDILLEVSDAVRETLIADMDDHELLAAAKEMDADELADLAPELPRDVVHELMESLDAQQRERVRSALSYEEDQVGALMDFEMVTIREDVSLEVVLRYLRRLKELPGHTDKLFVVDYDGVLKGVLPIKRLLVNDPDKQVAEVMASDPVTFHPDEDAYDAAQAFERYDLVSTPVVDKGGKLIGRLTIDEMVDLIREESESEVLNMAGLREEEDIFASVWKSVRNRWAWLAVNLVTAFIASRVIGLFDGSIEKLVALAALMPIVAGIGGNSGNQTITMIVRAMALDQVGTGNTTRLLRKEVGVGLVNGLVWGGVIGAVAWWLYGSWSLGVVMTAAMTLNLLLAALMGVLIPMTLARLGRDPAMGASVMITAMTDSGGFFIFLGLATIFLL
ncbi:MULTISPECIES: magnesium transporter [Stutzerimonas]|jgi:magnesium transporter|uniref:Magnesium transporter MgtE n=5 Tax=Stutzerimonas TaxID=2901164 RepID=A0A0D7E802_STUST|nr:MULTISPECIES: magnesium transporter [Stutzerimonas]KJS25492.1 MAG: magnesium transporter [Pseudomonas sp. BRH_c35]MBU1803725.1 magnesium transporter [Gammaproteobacteria bacterium]PKM01773.1 MAG: magnesium transporter [Gammaproteobacteria bacterium HGW-Gammaproteobacteria-6]HBW07290.1 magnesium transporter [Pseudomonas sp.]AFM32710.1 magnesium transporter [Stutzerimonas stutzeri CCUG 29243]|tara:strand:+ start:18654 stop:20087 length:1434 start_codon:yes stop_codon:yes gene_type:complete